VLSVTHDGLEEGGTTSAIVGSDASAGPDEYGLTRHVVRWEVEVVRERERPSHHRKVSPPRRTTWGAGRSGALPLQSSRCAPNWALRAIRALVGVPRKAASTMTDVIASTRG
jgi:hypothetical protein